VTGLPILHLGDGWLAVAKPAGLLVHRTDRASGVEEAAVQVVRDQVGRRVHPVHRLDRGASGVLLFALDAERTRALQAGLAAGTKRYLALVRGVVAFAETIVDRPLADDAGVLREARSTIRRLASCPAPRCSLVEVRPWTGRIHQVRRHVRGVDHPILGDARHGDTRATRAFREQTGLSRLALHCAQVALDVDGGTVTVTCPVPDDLGTVLRALPLWPAAIEAAPELLLPQPGVSG
jgi:tRNA pseudouridine65 synthase